MILLILTTLLPRPVRSVPFRRASLLNHFFNFHQLPTSTSPPSRTTPSNNTSRHRLCNGACLLQKNRQIPDGGEGVRMHGAELIFLPRQGPAMELLCLQGGLWVTAGWLPMP